MPFILQLIIKLTGKLKFPKSKPKKRPPPKRLLTEIETLETRY